MKWNSPPPYHRRNPFGITAFYQPTLCYEAAKTRAASPQRMGHPRHREGQKRKAVEWGTRVDTLVAPPALDYRGRVAQPLLQTIRHQPTVLSSGALFAYNHVDAHPW